DDAGVEPLSRRRRRTERPRDKPEPPDDSDPNSPSGDDRSSSTPPPPGRDRASICATSRLLDELADECMDALCRQNTPPVLFTRGFHLVRVVTSAERAPGIRLVGEAGLRNRLAEVAIFYRTRGENVVDCPPPLDAVRALLAREEWP